MKHTRISKRNFLDIFLFFLVETFVNHKIIELAIMDLMMDEFHKLFSMFDL
jgi:hypothetical protein